uniref:Outer membrane protein beta-barrel domain-containing protein n=1 Tax=candidate division WOR-3 bacterium TaxID=2052148 RepID=A0A7C3YTS8_UNCW3
MKRKGFRLKYLLIIVALATFSKADIVITTKEVIYGTVFEADTLYTRLRLPSGGIRVVRTADVYEIRLSDITRIESLAPKIPGVRVVPDTGKVFSRPETKAERVLLPDLIERGIYKFGGDANFTSTKGKSNLTLTPSLGYFVARGIAVGGGLTVERSSIGEMTSSLVILGPKAWFVFGPRGSSGFFFSEFGLAWASFGSDVTGTRTSFGVGYLPVISSGIGIPIKVSLLIDDMGPTSVNTWVISVGLWGLVRPTQFTGEGGR